MEDYKAARNGFVEMLEAKVKEIYRDCWQVASHIAGLV